ncbi:hypothetical protein GWK08_16530 [Leptobacterium flavescens]|uniref:Uncharacterized protein n=1 Tax=Leptobacterium flavescens TaxID=472055 RepID=A0A6P0UR98_9FLAO|nr:DUF6090 family protein [Leptobacterium flavescens]NER15062.1 hypothetical protein [Leptobacterium flavescens]
MATFFRKIRSKLLSENKITKYLIYAVGEIFLVVIGILIAIQVNNWNENRKEVAQQQAYEKRLIGELRIDLSKLRSLDSTGNLKKKLIYDYIDYYNSTSSDPELLNQKIETLNVSKRIFYTNAYTIQDLITTGNLALFPEHKRAAILQLKNIHDQYLYYETSTIEDVALYEQEIKKTFDLLNLNGLSNKEITGSKPYDQNLQSDQFRIFHNSLVESLKLFEFQSEMYEVMTKETSKLLEVLMKNNKG